MSPTIINKMRDLYLFMKQFLADIVNEISIELKIDLN